MTDTQVRGFVRRIREHVASDPMGRGFAWWAKSLGLRGMDLDAVLAEHERDEC